MRSIIDAVLPRASFLQLLSTTLWLMWSSQVRVEPLEIHKDRMTRSQTETKIDVTGWPNRFTCGEGPCYVPGVRVVISLPYTGDSTLWCLRPNTFSTMPPSGVVSGGCLQMTFEHPLDEPLDKIKQRLDENLRYVREHVSWQRPTVDSFNNGLAASAKAAVEARRSRLAKHDALADILNIPLARSGNAPEMRPIQVERRAVKPLPPPTGGYKPEWEVPSAEYEHILNVIRHEGRTFESTSRTYRVHDEEELRDIILAHLNGHYKGDATGETFRRAGKTDIRIEMDNRAAFVAECKLWKGPKSVTALIDQLLDYLIWRDCKTAIVIFNKETAGFTELLDKIPDALTTHPRFMKLVDSSSGGEWRCVVRSKDDDARLIHIAVFVFNLYVADNKK